MKFLGNVAKLVLTAIVAYIIVELAVSHIEVCIKKFCGKNCCNKKEEACEE